MNNNPVHNPPPIIIWSRESTIHHNAPRYEQGISKGTKYQRKLGTKLYNKKFGQSILKMIWWLQKLERSYILKQSTKKLKKTKYNTVHNPPSPYGPGCTIHHSAPGSKLTGKQFPCLFHCEYNPPPSKPLTSCCIADTPSSFFTIWTLAPPHALLGVSACWDQSYRVGPASFDCVVSNVIRSTFSFLPVVVTTVPWVFSTLVWSVVRLVNLEPISFQFIHSINIVEAFTALHFIIYNAVLVDWFLFLIR